MEHQYTTFSLQNLLESFQLCLYSPSTSSRNFLWPSHSSQQMQSPPQRRPQGWVPLAPTKMSHQQSCSNDSNAPKSLHLLLTVPGQWAGKKRRKFLKWLLLASGSYRNQHTANRKLKKYTRYFTHAIPQEPIIAVDNLSYTFFCSVEVLFARGCSLILLNVVCLLFLFLLLGLWSRSHAVEPNSIFQIRLQAILSCFNASWDVWVGFDIKLKNKEIYSF